MAGFDEQSFRRARLAELVARQPFAGNQAELARAMGLQSGALIYQMLSERRPITEKTVDKIHRMLGGKFRGWFDHPNYTQVLELGGTANGEPHASSMALARSLVDAVAGLSPLRWKAVRSILDECIGNPGVAADAATEVARLLEPASSKRQAADAA